MELHLTYRYRFENLVYFSAAGVMRFERGHPILDALVAAMRKGFDGDQWGSNGPEMVTKVSSISVYVA